MGPKAYRQGVSSNPASRTPIPTKSPCQTIEVREVESVHKRYPLLVAAGFLTTCSSTGLPIQLPINSSDITQLQIVFEYGLVTEVELEAKEVEVEETQYPSERLFCPFDDERILSDQ
ncbi:unnamed protein product [Microthlaspi erraticum]|uniref:Uncharacterized protein n=1 Tax=Microthlaspi erraticum TaxID=1685480 RepID=A0A6D2KJC0_9BRAS|nr:unnamed protein product [Microthlaspi erraticum]